MFRLLRSRLVRLAIGVFTLAGTAFWTVVAVVAAVMTTAAGGTDPDPDVARVAVPLGMLAAAGAVALGIAAMVAIRRGRVRQWVPLREQMVRDAATLPGWNLPRGGRVLHHHAARAPGAGVDDRAAVADHLARGRSDRAPHH